MYADADSRRVPERNSPRVLAGLLARLYEERFGGASSGRFRISRKFLRNLAGLRKLSDAYLSAVSDEMFENGYVFVDCESYSIVLSQKQFASYRRVTVDALNSVITAPSARQRHETEIGDSSEASESAATRP